MMFDPYAQGNPWIQAGWGGQPYGFGSQSLFSTPFGFGGPPQYQQFGSPGYFPGSMPIAPQSWFGHPLGSMQFGQPLHPFMMQHLHQQIPQLMQNAHQLAQQVPQLIQQIPQLLQQNPQLIQQAPQLQQVPQFLQQAAFLAHQIPQVLQALVSSPPTQTGFGVPFAGQRPFGYGQTAFS